MRGSRRVSAASKRRMAPTPTLQLSRVPPPSGECNDPYALAFAACGEEGRVDRLLESGQIRCRLDALLRDEEIGRALQYFGELSRPCPGPRASPPESWRSET